MMNASRIVLVISAVALAVARLAHAGAIVTPLAIFNGANGACPQAGVIVDASGNILWYDE
jgi:hypothetical protein